MMLSLTSEIRTPFHTVPAGRKLLALLGVSAAAFWIDKPAHALALLACVAAMYLFAGRRFARQGLTALRPLLFFVIIILIWHAATQDISGGIVITARMVALVALANLVTLTTPLAEILNRLDSAMTALRLPKRLRERLALAIALVIRFTPVLAQKGTALSEAWRARSPRRPRWRIAVPFVLLALDDADHVAEALRARSNAL